MFSHVFLENPGVRLFYDWGLLHPLRSNMAQWLENHPAIVRSFFCEGNLLLRWISHYHVWLWKGVCVDTQQTNVVVVTPEPFGWCFMVFPPKELDKIVHTRLCPPVISWFINHSKYIDISTINHSFWSYQPIWLTMGHHLVRMKSHQTIFNHYVTMIAIDSHVKIHTFQTQTSHI